MNIFENIFLHDVIKCHYKTTFKDNKYIILVFFYSHNCNLYKPKFKPTVSQMP